MIYMGASMNLVLFPKRDYVTTRTENTGSPSTVRGDKARFFVSQMFSAGVYRKSCLPRLADLLLSHTQMLLRCGSSFEWILKQ